MSWILRASHSVVHAGYGRCLAARTLYRDRSLVDLNKYPNTVTDDRVARSAVFSKSLFIYLETIVLVKELAPPRTFRAACLQLCQTGTFWDFHPLSSPTAILKLRAPSPTLHVYCPPQILPLTGLPVLFLPFSSFSSLRTESI